MEFIGAHPTAELTYSDVFLLPSRSGITSRLQVDLSPGAASAMTLPLISANMNSVTGARMAATLARRGGLGVLPQDLAEDQAVAAITWVKRQSVDWDSPVILPPHTPVAEALRSVPAVPGLGVVVAGHDDAGPARLSAVRGVVPATRLGSALPDARLGDLIHEKVATVSAAEISDAQDAFDAVCASGAETVCVVDELGLAGTITRKSAVRRGLYRAAVDADGRLLVAAALGINGDVAAKARALVHAGADILVLDTAHGHQDAMIDAVRRVRALQLPVPIASGNVVTAAAARDLAEAGADILKVGVGPGAMCTTRMMTAVGRPQFSAVLETAQAARELGVTVWADGGVRYPRDVALALAAGASAVMIGSWFACTIESPGQVAVDESGRAYKESWGMASTKAVQARVGDMDAYQRARKELFAEGISSSRIYLDPLRPGVEDLLDMITSGVRSSFSYAGAATLAEFHDRARVGLQSAAGYEEGKALPVIW